MSRVCRVLPWLFGAALAGMVAPAQAQSNLDAGKSPAQIFSDTCNACHRSPREIKPTSSGFLREHYSTGPREAAAMAAYLASVGSDTRAVQQRKPPALGAGQAPDPAARPGQAASADPGKPPEAQAGAPPAAKPRRPSDSIEAGSLPVAAGGGTEASPSPASAAARPDPAAAFEE